MHSDSRRMCARVCLSLVHFLSLSRSLSLCLPLLFFPSFSFLLSFSLSTHTHTHTNTHTHTHTHLYLSPSCEPHCTHRRERTLSPLPSLSSPSVSMAMSDPQSPSLLCDSLRATPKESAIGVELTSGSLVRIHSLETEPRFNGNDAFCICVFKRDRERARVHPR